MAYRPEKIRRNKTKTKRVPVRGERVAEQWTVMGTRAYWVPVGIPVGCVRAVHVFEVSKLFGKLLACFSKVGVHTSEC